MGNAMPAAKIIKRYANRKLYDTERSCYVTLDDISLMINAGDDVKVIDNKSGEDLTSVTLAQIVFESEKQKNFMPLGLLRDIIRSKGGTLSDFYRERVELVQAKAQDLRETAQAKAQTIRDRADRLRNDLGGRIEGAWRKSEEGVKKPIQELVGSSQKALDELQTSVEQRIKGGVGLLGRELDQLRSKLTELEDRLGRPD